MLASWRDRRGVPSARSEMPSLCRRTLHLPNLPGSWDGLRIAQIADVHAGPFMPASRMRRIRDMVVAAAPDVIVFTGDQLDRRASDAARFIRGFSSTEAPLGAFGILGNHDHMVGADLAVDSLQRAGITPLVNHSIVFDRDGRKLALVGIDDLDAPAPHRPDFSVLGSHPDAFRICLCHQPQGWHEALANGAHLTLAGHTHGGQIAITSRNLNMARFHSRYIAGAYRREDAFLHVSRGVGVGALPLRVGAPPEIDLITLRRTRASGRAAA
jgi:predicted MPP superfamily phosphohydrolase